MVTTTRAWLSFQEIIEIIKKDTYTEKKIIPEVRFYQELASLSKRLKRLTAHILQHKNYLRHMLEEQKAVMNETDFNIAFKLLNKIDGLCCEASQKEYFSGKLLYHLTNSFYKENTFDGIDS